MKPVPISTYRLKVPIKKQLKTWLAKWLNQEPENLIIDTVKDQNLITSHIQLALSSTNPCDTDREMAFNDCEMMFVVLPKGKYLSEAQVYRLNQIWYHHLIDQLTAVMMARKDVQPSVAYYDVFDTYRFTFGVEMSDETILKAVNRYLKTRKISRFKVIPRPKC